MSIIFASKISFKLFWFPPSSTPPSHWSCHHLSPANGNFFLNGQVPSAATHPSLSYTQRMVSEYRPDCHRWVKQPDVKVKTTFLDRPALCTILLLLPPRSLLHKAYLCSSHTDFRSSALSALCRISSLRGPFTCSPWWVKGSFLSSLPI